MFTEIQTILYHVETTTQLWLIKPVWADWAALLCIHFRGGKRF